MPSAMVLVSLVFLSIAFSFALTVFMKFLKSPYSVPLLFLSIFLIFLVVSETFRVIGETSLVRAFELVSFVSLFLSSFSIYRLFARKI